MQDEITRNDMINKALMTNALSEFVCHNERFLALFDMLTEANEKFNLTNITGIDKYAYLHLSDSLMASAFIPDSSIVADVGAGAGFPGLVLAIARRDCRFFEIESNSKKCLFMKEAAHSLGLDNIEVICARAEEISRTEMRESFDAVISRALARLNVLSELDIPLVKNGGLFLAMKGKDGATEFAEAEGAIKKLGCSGRAERYSFYGPEEMERYMIVCKKTEKTGETYPRSYSKIKKSPL